MQIREKEWEMTREVIGMTSGIAIGVIIAVVILAGLNIAYAYVSSSAIVQEQASVVNLAESDPQAYIHNRTLSASRKTL